MADTIQVIKQQAEQARTQVQQQQAQAQRDIETEAQRLRREQHEAAKEVEKQVEETKEAIRKQEARVKRAREAPGIKVAKPAVKVKEVEQAQKEAQRQVKLGKEEIAKAEAAAKTELASQVQEAMAEIATEEQKAISEFKDFAANNVELSTGEWIGKTAFSELDKDDQDLLVKLGIDKFNEAKDKDFKATHVELRNGEWIDKDYYNNLDTGDRAYLWRNGIEAWNSQVEKQNQEAIEESFVAFTELSHQAHTQVGINRTEWAKLSVEDRQKAFDSVVEKIESQNEQQSWDYYQSLLKTADVATSITRQDWASFSPDKRGQQISAITDRFLITLDTDELVDKDWFDTLPREQQAYLTKNGVQAFRQEFYITLDNGELVDKDWYNKITETQNKEEQDFLNKNGVDAFYKEYYIKTAKDELVSKNWLDTLDTSWQAIIVTQGLDAFDQYVSSHYVILQNTNELIDKDFYNSLSSVDQIILQASGVKGYEAEQKRQQDIFEATHVQAKNGDWIDKNEYNSLSATDQKLIMQVGVKIFNYRKEQELNNYLTDLGKNYPRAKDWVDKYGIEDFNKWLDKANNETPERAFTILQQIGLIDKWAEYAGTDDKGQLQYVTPQAKGGQAIDLEKINYSHLTEKDYYNIAFTASRDSRFRILVNGKPSLPLSYTTFALTLPKNEKDTLQKLARDVVQSAHIATIEGAVVDVAKMIVPGLWALDWKEMSTSDRALNIFIDVVTVGLFFAPAIAKMIKPLPKNIAKLASEAGKEWKNLQSITAEIKDIPLLEPKLARTLQQTVQASQTADARLFKALEGLTKLTTRQLKAIEKLSGIEGLARAIEDIGKAQKNLLKAWNELDRLTISTERYTTQLTRVQSLQNNLVKLLNGYDHIASPRVFRSSIARPSFSREWDDIIKLTERQLSTAQQDYNKVIKYAGKDARMVREAADYVKSIELKLEDYIKAAGRGDLPPSISAYTVTTKKAEAIPFFIEQEPVISPLGTGRGRPVAVIEKVKPKLAFEQTYKVKVSPASYETKELATAKVAVPKVAEKASVFPGVIPKIKAPPEKAMSPEEYREWLYKTQKGDIDTYVEAIAGNIIQIIPNATPAVQSVVRSIARNAVDSAIRAATLVETRAGRQTRAIGQTQARSMIQEAVKSVVKAIPQSAVKSAVSPFTKAITNSATKLYSQLSTAVEPLIKLQAGAATKAATRVKTKAGAEVLAGLPLPVLTVKLPDGTSRSLSKEELEGSISWKQGFIYILRFPPFKPKDVAYSKKPFPGVKVYKGARSAYKSIIKRGGKVPSRLAYDMGIMDISIITTGGKPKLKFKRDVKQRTHHAGISVTR